MTAKILQPTYKRQRFLLSFIRQMQSGVSFTDLQKLVFLYTMKEGLDFYDFVPYKYGSYSFQLAEDVDILQRDDFLLTKGSRIRAIGEYPYKVLYAIVSERGDNLIRKAYREYPYYAINSEIIKRLFNDEEAEYFKQQKQHYTKTGKALFTVGYEGKSVDAFINILIKNDVRLLCDVRKNPLSRKFGFSKRMLEHITQTIGIKYIHIPELGIESNKRRSLDTKEDYQNLFSEYEKSLPNNNRQLEWLYEQLNADNRIALMCYEKKSTMCHRHLIREYLTQHYEIRGVDL